MMTCQHHPEYDPASGEPTGTLLYYPVEHPDRRTPCGNCWQARAKWLEKVLEQWKATAQEQTRRTNVAGSKAITYLQRIKELEGLLEEVSLIEKAMRLSYEIVKKDEAKLREALEPFARE